jgi:hypothetical protein
MPTWFKSRTEPSAQTIAEAKEQLNTLSSEIQQLRNTHQGLRDSINNRIATGFAQLATELTSITLPAILSKIPESVKLEIREMITDSINKEKHRLQVEIDETWVQSIKTKILEEGEKARDSGRPYSNSDVHIDHLVSPADYKSPFETAAALLGGSRCNQCGRWVAG